MEESRYRYTYINPSDHNHQDAPNAPGHQVRWRKRRDILAAKNASSYMARCKCGWSGKRWFKTKPMAERMEFRDHLNELFLQRHFGEVEEV